MGPPAAARVCTNTASHGRKYACGRPEQLADAGRAARRSASSASAARERDALDHRLRRASTTTSERVRARPLRRPGGARARAWSTNARSTARLRPAAAHSSVASLARLDSVTEMPRAGPERQRPPATSTRTTRVTPAASTTSTSSAHGVVHLVGARVLPGAAEAVTSMAVDTPRRRSRERLAPGASARRWSARSPRREDARGPAPAQLALVDRRVVSLLERLHRARPRRASPRAGAASRRARAVSKGSFSRGHHVLVVVLVEAERGSAPTPAAAARGTSRWRTWARSTRPSAERRREAGSGASRRWCARSPTRRRRPRPGRARRGRQPCAARAPGSGAGRASAPRPAPRRAHRAERRRAPAREELREVRRRPSGAADGAVAATRRRAT